MDSDPAELIKDIPWIGIPRVAAAPKPPKYEEPYQYCPPSDDGDTVDFMPDPEFQPNDLRKQD